MFGPAQRSDTLCSSELSRTDSKKISLAKSRGYTPKVGPMQNAGRGHACNSPDAHGLSDVAECGADGDRPLCPFA
jgi:hypothetical protein